LFTFLLSSYDFNGQILEAIKANNNQLQSLKKPLEYTGHVFQIIKEFNQQGKQIVIDKDFFNTTIEKCLEAKNEEVLPPLLELARYFVDLLKSVKAQK